MPRLTIKLYAALKEAAGAARLDATGETLPEVLADLGRQGGPGLVTMLFEADGRVRPGFQLLLGTTYLDQHKLGAVVIRDGDTLHVMPPIAGG